MPNPELLGEKQLSRRDLLRFGGKVAVAATGVVALNGIAPRIIEASANIASRLVVPTENTSSYNDFNEIPWSSGEWWPISGHHGKLLLIDDWMQTRNGWVRGPLALHDEIAQRVFDYRTN